LEKLFKKGILTVRLALCGLVFLSGCSEMRQAVSDMIKPLNAGEVSVQVSTLAADGKIALAIQVGEDFLLKNKDPSGDLHRQLAQLYTRQGDTISALRHLQQTTPGAPVTQAASTPPQPSAASENAAVPTAGPSASVDGASAQVGPSGIEVRAGGLSVKISK
jgi:hypothetical protein